MTKEESMVIPGAHLMAFSISAMYNDGIVYYPGLPNSPGAMSVPFTYKFGEDGPRVAPDQLILGVAASTCQRRGKLGVATTKLR